MSFRLSCRGEARTKHAAVRTMLVQLRKTAPAVIQFLMVSIAAWPSQRSAGPVIAAARGSGLATITASRRLEDPA